MSTQLTMFADDGAKPTGLLYQPEFISVAEEARLIAHISALPLAPFQFGAYEGKRRVVYFGTRYDFTHQRLEDAEALPDWLRDVAARLERFASLPAGSIDFLWSHSVLANVRKADLAPLIGETRRILKPGGLASHDIDYRDHLDRGLRGLA